MSRADFRPHERSSDAKQLAWTFVVVERLMAKALEHEQVLGGGFHSAPASWEAVVDAFNATHDEIGALLSDPRNGPLDGTATFFSGPKQTPDFPTAKFLWFLLMDQVHHRGQLSVYVRTAGGKVPSIYGPWADEPWF